MVNKMNEIDVIIDKIDDLRNKFNDKKFSKDFYDYIEIESDKSRDKKDVIIKFDLISGTNNKEREEIKKIYTNHYEHLVNDLSNHISYENGKMIALIIFGLIFLCLYYLFQSHDVIIISDIFLIIGWLAVWESVYNLLFVENETKNKLKQYKKLKNAKIEFVR